MTTDAPVTTVAPVADCSPPAFIPPGYALPVAAPVPAIHVEPIHVEPPPAAQSRWSPLLELFGSNAKTVSELAQRGSVAFAAGLTLGFMPACFVVAGAASVLQNLALGNTGWMAFSGLLSVFPVTLCIAVPFGIAVTAGLFAARPKEGESRDATEQRTDSRLERSFWAASSGVGMALAVALAVKCGAFGWLAPSTPPADMLRQPVATARTEVYSPALSPLQSRLLDMQARYVPSQKL